VSRPAERIVDLLAGGGHPEEQLVRRDLALTVVKGHSGAVVGW